MGDVGVGAVFVVEWWVSSVCGWCVHGGVDGVFVVVGCAGEKWGGWVLVCWVDLYNPYMVPHTIT